MRLRIYSIFFITVIASLNLRGAILQENNISGSAETINYADYDTLKENQVLYNGRIWRNLHYMIEGDQFLFSRSFLPGSIAMRGKTFNNIKLLYDIYNDEILIPSNTGSILQLNKEMIDSFTVFHENRAFHFTKLSQNKPVGYLNVIYNGESALFIKYSKKIEKMADQGKYDKFYELNQTYYLKDSILYPISGKRDLKKILPAEKELINNFLRKNKFRISKQNPDSFIPLIRYLDELQ